MIEPAWAKRNTFLDQFNLEDCSVIDFGCGDKSLLNYQQPKEYVGLDKNPMADIVVDFDNEVLDIEKHYDIGLILGVLEYLEKPDSLIENYRHCIDRFIIMVLNKDNPKIRRGWKQSYNKITFDNFIKSHFENYSITQYNKYLIAECYS